MSNTGTDIRLISAAAGTGKTTRLVDEIVRALDLHAGREIVAVTFTNAAVRDLRDKITKRLKDSPKKSEADDITISTIHSFFAQLLREQSMKLNISPSFGIMSDSPASQIIFEDICKGVISSRIKDEEYRELFLEYSFRELIDIMETLESRFSSIRHNLKKGQKDFLELERNGEAQKLHQMTGERFVAEVLDVLIETKCPAKGNTFVEGINAIINDVKELRTALDRFGLGHAPGSRVFKRNLLQAASDILRKMDFPKNVRYPQKADGWESPEHMKYAIDAYKRLKEVARETTELSIGINFVSEQAAAILTKLLKIFSLVHEGFVREKTERELLDYNDIEIMAHDLIHDYPGIAEHYRARYSYILVDEFQDTNDLQSRTLRQLSRKLFFVGDAKQSIYRFRNADVRVFVDAQRSIQQGNYEELTHSYRSRQSIVDMVNKGFETLFDRWIEDKQSFDPDYMKMSVHPDRQYPDQGIVKFLNVGGIDDRSANVELEALCTANLIHERIQAGRKPQDFAVLFKEKAQIPVFEKFLVKKEIPYVVWGETNKEDVIQRIRSLFGFIHNPYDNFNFFETAKLPPFYLSDECMHKLRLGGECLWEALKGYDLTADKYRLSKQDNGSIRALRSFFERCEKIRARGGNFTEYVSQVLSLSRLIPSAAMVHPGQETGLEEMVLKIAQEVEETGGGLSDLMEFLSVMDSDKNDLTVKNAVQLMTVHASKGLDFPVVILPCLHKDHKPRDLFVISQFGDISLKLRDQLMHDRRPTPHHSFIKEDEARAELAESKRVFYVACTRAKEELYLLGNFRASLEHRLKPKYESETEELKAKDSRRWLDWTSFIYREQIEDISFKEGETDIQSRILREMIMINDPARLFAPIPEQIRKKQFRITRRYTVSMVRDFVISPQTMLDNIMGLDAAELAPKPQDAQGSEQMGSIVHSLLENYGDEEALKDILIRIPEKTMRTAVDIVNKFAGSELGKKVLEAEEHRSEHGFLLKVADDVITGRIDRINIYKDRIWVLDYKTGIDEKMLEGYKAQMACYLYYVQQLYPGLPVTGSIIDVAKNREISFDSSELRVFLEKTLSDMSALLMC